MFGLECGTVCSRDMDVDSDRQKTRCLWNVDMEMRRIEKISWLDKVTNEEVLRRVNEDWQKWTLFGKGTIDGLAMFWDTTDFCMKFLEAEWEVNQRERDPAAQPRLE